MPYSVGLAGKGGTGKTTIAGLLVIRLIARGCKPVLAIDADPNTCLDAALDVHVTNTIGGVREEAREMAGKGMASGISKQELPTAAILLRGIPDRLESLLTVLSLYMSLTPITLLPLRRPLLSVFIPLAKT